MNFFSLFLDAEKTKQFLVFEFSYAWYTRYNFELCSFKPFCQRGLCLSSGISSKLHLFFFWVVWIFLTALVWELLGFVDPNIWLIIRVSLFLTLGFCLCFFWNFVAFLFPILRKIEDVEFQFKWGFIKSWKLSFCYWICSWILFCCCFVCLLSFDFVPPSKVRYIG